MNDFQLSPEVDKNKIFLIKYSELEGRWDPAYNLALIKNKIPTVYPKHKIGQISKSISGGTPSKANLDYWVGDIPWISPKDMKDFYLIDSIDHISEQAVEKSSTNIVPKETVLLVVRSGILQHTIPISIATREMAINQDIKALIFNDSVLPVYAAYFINVYQSKLLPLIVKHSTTVQSINTEQFDSLLIPIPPKEIQAQIVVKMDTAYAAKKQKEAEAQRLLDSIDDYLLGELGIELPEQEENTVQSRIFIRQFSEVSGGRLDAIYYSSDLNKLLKGQYKSSKIKDIAARIISGVGAGRQDQAGIDEGIIQIRPTNIDVNGSLKYDRNIFLPSDQQSEKIDIDDVLFNNTNSQVLVGKTSILKESKELYFSNHITKITVGRLKVLPDYLVCILNLYQRHKVFYFICTNWNNQSGIGLDLLKSLRIPLPSLEKQTEIANHIAGIRTQAKKLQQQAKADLEQAKKEVEAMILGD
ncbi:restriction endonuclease subunit S [Candidatus Haliotispira prima]|uniref:Restriction endonuclease subunit S n=1 Tax=Candidatus Haliotispira prima TaxID=3034016 RepID=A0ABY8MHV2_9SPIO|nr:restriction endonuclease subunit S [Candidatus Haliotispira prima]